MALNHIQDTRWEALISLQRFSLPVNALDASFDEQIGSIYMYWRSHDVWVVIEA